MHIISAAAIQIFSVFIIRLFIKKSYFIKDIKTNKAEQKLITFSFPVTRNVFVVGINSPARMYEN